MENYADYDFYQNQYMGSISIDLFNSLIVKASRDIDRNVNVELNETVIENLSEKEKYQLYYTACELVDFINENEIGSASSVSIDGVSISGMSKDEQKVEKRKIYNDLPIKLTRYL